MKKKYIRPLAAAIVLETSYQFATSIPVNNDTEVSDEDGVYGRGSFIDFGE